jgi:ATP-dependent Lon protease
VAFDYFKANAGRVSASIHPTERDFHLHMVELQTAGTPEALTLASFIVLCSAALGKPVQSQMVVMGDMSLGGTITQAATWRRACRWRLMPARSGSCCRCRA